jgi:hypothetical protein
MRPETVCGRLRGIGLALALLAVASCGGGGGGGGGSSAPPTPGSKLFITDGGNDAIASIVNAAPTINSPSTIDRIVQGSSTGLGTGGPPSISSIPSIALDAANDRVFAATRTNVVVFDHAGTANGNVPYSRLMSATVDTGGGPRGVDFYGLYLDTANNILYTVDPAGEVHVFSSASTRTGATTPDRTVTPNLGTTTIVVSTFGIAVDKIHDLLYVGIAPSGANPFIIVFNGASTANTNISPNSSRTPDRTITLARAGAFHLDEANDRLYVSRFDGVVWVFDNASGLLTGTPTQNRTINMANTVQNFIFVDTSRDKLYAVSNDPNTANRSLLDIVDNASTANEPTVNGLSTFITATNIRFSAVAVKP